jgi:hypothetical protein
VPFRARRDPELEPDAIRALEILTGSNARPGA